jgi:hypothetical protein
MKTNLICFTGQMGSGKTTATHLTVSALVNRGYSPKLVKFADPIYNIMHSMCDISRIEFDKSRLRPVMQYIGSYFRANYTPNFWVDHWELEVKHKLFFDGKLNNQKVVILCDDVRYDNEAEKIRNLSGVLFKVQAGDATRGERIPLVGTEHVSESGISPGYITGTIYNESNKEDLRLNIEYLLDNLDA